MTYKERAALCSNVIAKKLFTIMEEKQSNLVLSADLNSTSDLLQVLFALSELYILR